jgi:hypothetical protein
LALAENFVFNFGQETALAFSLDCVSDCRNVFVVPVSALTKVPNKLENVQGCELQHLLENPFEIGAVASDSRVGLDLASLQNVEKNFAFFLIASLTEQQRVNCQVVKLNQLFVFGFFRSHD